jgi:KDO2-lipid IV(A) lauroyltransferase
MEFARKRLPRNQHRFGFLVPLARQFKSTPGLIRLLRDAAIALVVLPFVAPVAVLPWGAASALGRWYGYAAWAVCPYARRVGMINLRRAQGPQLSRAEARRAVREVFGSIGQSIAEGVQFTRKFRHAPHAVEGFYECEDAELEQRILSDPRPRILVTGHLGSWELAPMIAAVRSGRPGGAIVRRLDNPFLNAVWRKWRVRQPSEWIEKRGASAVALRLLRDGRDIALLIDEDAGYRGLFVPLFGRPASTRKTAAVLSLATGAPIVMAACIRRPGRRFLLRHALFEPDTTLPPGDAVRDLTARMVATYESWIRDAPLQWRWIHWRWKTQPGGIQESYRSADLRAAFSRDRGASPSPEASCS